jgi:class 3 adenylate cyclase/TolB-like protein/Tfp pilus assembly protein PilF
VERRIAAIVAADMAGFSRLVELDEANVIARQKRHFAELIGPEIESARGRIVKRTGDGLIAEFPSVVDAVRASVRIQKEMTAREADQPEDRRIRYRVAVNLGDIIVEDDDVYGDGVNIAARLEALAEPGGIVVSGEAYDHLKTKAGVGFRPMGEQQLKNIATPVRVFQVVDEATGLPVARRRPRRALAGTAAALALVLAAGGIWWSSQTDFTPADAAQMRYALSDKPSIAVLPFSRIGDTSDREVLRDGLAVDLTASLSRARTFVVISSNSMLTYKDKAPTPAEVAQDMGVRYVVQGTIQRAGDDLRINVELVDALAGNIVWAEKYRRGAADFFEIQDDISARITALLSGEYGLVGQAELARAKRKAPNDLTAYELTLMAKEIRDQFGKENNQKALKLLLTAVERDPEFAGAYIGLTWTYAQEAWNDWRTIDYDIAVQKAAESGRRAVTLDPDSANAHYALGSVQFWDLGQREEAIASYQRALELEPNNTDLLMMWGGFILPSLDRVEEGYAIAEKAVRLNPYHDDWYNFGLQVAAFGVGSYDEAVRHFNATKFPNAGAPVLNISALALAGRFEDARAEGAKLLEKRPGFSGAEFVEAEAYSEDVGRRVREGLLLAGLPE